MPLPHLLRHGHGTPVIFVHGNGVDHRILLGLDDVFGNGFERFHFDLPGFGRTPALTGAGGLPELADWLDRTVGELLGERPFAVVGNSMGGLLAYELAARRPTQVLGMALLAPVVHTERARRTLPERVVLRWDPELLRSLKGGEAMKYAEMTVVQSPETWEAFRKAVLPGMKAADPAALERLSARYFLNAAHDGALRAFAGPVLIVAGRQDHVVGFEDQFTLARSFPRGSYAVLDAAGHNVHLDQPAAVRALLEGWVAALGDRLI
ncbi:MULTISPECIES: alpha/beta fold hydrolase [Arthrobacter]|uniref:Alpha/beta fold hydrolase n=2 Tax=Arthrobacter TaxID=1663 RepID=A0ABU9KK04_9MICC|nr:alpha/beta fold hydrolase [Arthrobacter sp. YJM1]MDP5227104.1 alpha/beta fold hydrolase [Arthrobacter sp. YJM1]